MLEDIQSAFRDMEKCKAWSLQLLRIKPGKNKPTEYAAISVSLSPQGKLAEIAKEISDFYIKEEGGKLKSYVRVQDYDGTAEENVIYKLDINNKLIKEEHESFINALAHAEQEANPLEQKLQAFVIQGDIGEGDDKRGIKLISMQNPITTLKHKFMHVKNTFEDISVKVLSLRSTIDVMILDDKVYLFSMAGERLFNMERAYKAVCEEKATMVEKGNILCEGSIFGNVARTGHHPRMFVSFSEKRYEKLQSLKERKRYAELFGIPLKKGKFDTSEEEAADKLVRVLCKKGMVDPFEDQPVEVTGARKWQ